MMTIAEVGKVSGSIGYAIGVLEAFVSVGELNDRQRGCVVSAINGLREIDLCKLLGLDVSQPGQYP